MDINSLRFGASEEVNFGRGSTVLRTEMSGDDLIVTFKGEGNGITNDNLAAKMLGKTSDGNLLFGDARLPWVNYLEPALSARMPVITPFDKGFKLEVEAQNFGQVASQTADLDIVYLKNGLEEKVATAKISGLDPFQKTKLELTCGSLFEKGVEYNMIVRLNPDDRKPVTLHGKITPVL